MTAQNTCACGKVGWLNRAKAEDVLVRAKIAFTLYGNKRRREQRTYECLTRRGTWHLTSQPRHLPDQSIEPPAYRVDDDDTAREYLSGALFHGDKAAWTGLHAPDRIHQTHRVLGLMHQASMLEGHERKRTMPPAEYREWLQIVEPLRRLLEIRIREAQLEAHRVTTAANITRSQGRTHRENVYLKGMVRRLTLELAEHRDTLNRTPSPTDRRLWALLDTLHMPRAEKPIGEIVASGGWCWVEDEYPLNGDVS